MKKILAATIGAALSFGAAAAPATALPPGPIYLKFTGQEQIAVNGATTFAGSKEINWGVFIISTLDVGSVNTPHDQIDPTGNEFFSNGASRGGADKGSQITGMFYGIEQGEASPTNQFPATKGYMDLYWRDLNLFSKSSLDTNLSPSNPNPLKPNVRCGWDCAAGFTDGTFLGRLFFDTGMDVNSSVNTIVGSTIPSSNGFTGTADSYASVDMTHMGLWSEQLDSDFFKNSLGTRDLRFKNSYNYNRNFNGGPNILGARIDDPGQAYALPEPGALSLMGLAMVGMGAALRRRQKQA
ncbi:MULTISPECIES: PEP-CTERM sorting domain-containing protein [unclassified Massilia]|uniref:PEP-CTERM sorting domain-containing protein n=1 Tax=unclassified Massilia TaxID=2609279 RepID=UPI001B83308A|nr:MULTISPECIES: PEP-CTERM sorting domain-containing protein [unclassified Massilia]MBQ5942594.1 PEP-CTERM sorting domain-containing protein [Massilia sp. AB1]MBQ5964783.1 PEP-CTERM sorting domain-containing protein [Massilia sp. ZL223]